MFGADRDLELLKAFRWERLAEDTEIRAIFLSLFYFHNELMCRTGQNGWTFTGCSFSPQGRMTRLAVKAVHDDIPQVAFTTAATTTSCVRAFCRAWLEERVKWYPDKFA